MTDLVHAPACGLSVRLDQLKGEFDAKADAEYITGTARIPISHSPDELTNTPRGDVESPLFEYPFRLMPAGPEIDDESNVTGNRDRPAFMTSLSELVASMEVVREERRRRSLEVQLEGNALDLNNSSGAHTFKLQLPPLALAAIVGPLTPPYEPTSSTTLPSASPPRSNRRHSYDESYFSGIPEFESSPRLRSRYSISPAARSPPVPPSLRVRRGDRYKLILEDNTSASSADGNESVRGVGARRIGNSHGVGVSETVVHPALVQFDMEPVLLLDFEKTSRA